MYEINKLVVRNMKCSVGNFFKLNNHKVLLARLLGTADDSGMSIFKSFRHFSNNLDNCNPALNSTLVFLLYSKQLVNTCLTSTTRSDNSEYP